MARCDQGYLCQVCQDEVSEITESSLYLRFVIGELDPEVLHTEPDCHLNCNPTLSQFILDARFQPSVEANGPFSKENLDPSFRKERELLVTRGYERLWEIKRTRKQLTVVDYPLPDCRSRWMDFKTDQPSEV